MNLPVLKSTIIDMEMDLNELIFERLGMSYEDLLYELHPRLMEALHNFEDLERVEL